MKYVKILLAPVKIKADLDDPETIQQELYEKISTLIESEDLKWEIDPEDENDDEDM